MKIIIIQWGRVSVEYASEAASAIYNFAKAVLKIYLMIRMRLFQ
jgi:hypothetical protein